MVFKNLASCTRLFKLIWVTFYMGPDLYGFTTSLSHHLYSIWLFLFSDLKTIIGPMTVFGTVNALSTLAFEMDQTDMLAASQILARIPRVSFWIVCNLLPFVIDNQRHPKAILEDNMNKPWRPIPSKRLRPELAKAWMLVFYLVAVLVSLGLGGLRQCIILLFLGVWYNDYGGADVHYSVRSLINTSGFVSYASGAMEVALGEPLSVKQKLMSWFALIAAVVFTSVHSQDLPDQKGDRLRGRKTVPLVLGDEFARWSIASSVLIFSIFCPRFWDSTRCAFLTPILLGATVSTRTLVKRTVRADRITFLLWNLWIVILYSLPLIKSIELGIMGSWMSAEGCSPSGEMCGHVAYAFKGPIS